MIKQIIILLLLSTYCYADIDSVSGTISQSQSVALIGESFGSHADYDKQQGENHDYLCIAYEDFEDGTVTDNYETENGDITTSGARTNKTKSFAYAKIKDEDKDVSGDGLFLTNYKSNDELYVCFYFKQPVTITKNEFEQYKMFRAWRLSSGGLPNFYPARVFTGAENAGGTIFTGEPTSTGVYYQWLEESSGFAYDDFMNDLDWHCIEVYLKMETGTEGSYNDDGKIRLWIDGNIVLSSDSIQTNTNNYNGDGYYNTVNGLISFGDYVQDFENLEFLQYDNCYVNATQTRVMLCANADGSGHREIQIPLSWSDTQIQVRVNQGSFTTGQTAYLCVFNSDGTVVASKAVTIGQQYGRSKTLSTKLTLNTKCTI